MTLCPHLLTLCKGSSQQSSRSPGENAGTEGLLESSTLPVTFSAFHWWTPIQEHRHVQGEGHTAWERWEVRAMDAALRSVHYGLLENYLQHKGSS